MSSEPANISRHLDAIACTQGGGLFLSASSLTNRTWSGSLWYFDDPTAAPDPARTTTGTDTESAITDIVILDDTRALTGSDSGAVCHYHYDDKALLCDAHSVEHDDIVTSISLTADKNRLISASLDASIKIWDLEQFISTNSYKAHYECIQCVCCHPTNSSLFITAGQDGRLLLWDTRLSKPASFLDTRALPSNATWIAWQPSEEHGIVVAMETGELCIQDIRKGVAPPVVVSAHQRAIRKTKFASHNPDWLASCGEDGQVVVTDVKAGRIIYRDTKHTDFVTDVAWDHHNNRLFTCGWDTLVEYREVTEGEHISRTMATMDISEKVQMASANQEIIQKVSANQEKVQMASDNQEPGSVQEKMECNGVNGEGDAGVSVNG